VREALQEKQKRAIKAWMTYLSLNSEKMYTIKLSTKYRREFKKLEKNIKVLKELYFVISKLQK